MHGLEHKKQAWFADPRFVVDQIIFLIILFHQKLGCVMLSVFAFDNCDCSLPACSVLHNEELIKRLKIFPVWNSVANKFKLRMKEY